MLIQYAGNLRDGVAMYLLAGCPPKYTPVEFLGNTITPMADESDRCLAPAASFYLPIHPLIPNIFIAVVNCLRDWNNVLHSTGERWVLAWYPGQHPLVLASSKA